MDTSSGELKIEEEKEDESNILRTSYEVKIKTLLYKNICHLPKNTSVEAGDVMSNEDPDRMDVQIKSRVTDWL